MTKLDGSNRLLNDMNTPNIVVKVNLNNDEYSVNIEQLRKKLSTIENDYYSSNIKLERVKHKHGFKTPNMKSNRILSLDKKSITEP